MGKKIGIIIASLITIVWSVVTFVFGWLAYKDFFANLFGHLPGGFPDWCWNIVYFIASVIIVGITTAILNYCTREG